MRTVSLPIIVILALALAAEAVSASTATPVGAAAISASAASSVEASAPAPRTRRWGAALLPEPTEVVKKQVGFADIAPAVGWSWLFAGSFLAGVGVGFGDLGDPMLTTGVQGGLFAASVVGFLGLFHEFMTRSEIFDRSKIELALTSEPETES